MSLILHYKLNGENQLPIEYTQLNYIEGDGNSYIDTGVYDNNDLKIEGSFMPISYNKYVTFFSNGDSSIHGIRFFMNSVVYCGYNASRLANNIYIPLKTKCFVTFSKTECTLNSTTLSCNVGTTVVNDTLKLLYDGTQGASYGRIYSCKIWKSNKLIRDFVPVVNSSNEVGLFDKVNQVFYSNAGTGTFSKGIKVVSLPQEYQQVEYLQSRGASYINIGFIPNLDTRITGQFASCNLANYIFGSDSNSDITIDENSYGLSFTDGHYRIRYGSSKVTLGTITTDKIFEYDLNKNVVSIDGTVINTFDSTTFTGTLALVLFANNKNGTISNYSISRICNMYIYDNGTLVRLLIACYRKCNSIPGLYDLVNDVFYAGTSNGYLLGTTIDANNLEYNVQGTNLFPSNPSKYGANGMSLTKSGNNWIIKTSTTTASTTIQICRWYNLRHNGIKGPWSISFDAVATADVSLQTDICDLAVDKVTIGKQIDITTTKLRFFITSTATGYYTTSAYNGFWDLQIIGPTSEVITITISNIVLQLGALSKPSNIIPINTEGIHFNTGKDSLKSDYDSNYYFESDGSKWIRIFHHSNPYNDGNGNLFLGTDNMLNVYKDETRWSQFELFNKVNRWEVMIKLAATTDSTEEVFRFTLDINPLVLTSARQSNYNTSSEYSISKYGAIKYINSSTYLCCGTSAWWGAFGVWTIWETYKIPGWNGTKISTGYSDLYLRVDNAFENNIQFDSTQSSYIKCPSINLDMTSFSVGCWYKFTSTNSYARIADFLSTKSDTLSGASTKSSGFIIARSSTNSVITVHLYYNGNDYFSAISNLTLDTWYHILFTVEDTTMKIYINGKLSSTTTLEASLDTNAYMIYNYLGRSNWTADKYLDGNIRDFRIYDNVLTAAEVAAIYNSTN